MEPPGGKCGGGSQLRSVRRGGCHELRRQHRYSGFMGPHEAVTQRACCIAVASHDCSPFVYAGGRGDNRAWRIERNERALAGTQEAVLS